MGRPFMLRAPFLRIARSCAAPVAFAAFAANNATRCDDTEALRPGAEALLAKAKATSVRQAHLLYKQAAELGDLDAVYRLAKNYLNGVGTVKDPIHAAELLQSAAEKGHARATYTLAVLYRLGQGVEQDIRKANELLKKAAEAGSMEALAAMQAAGNFHTDAKADFGRGRLQSSRK